LIVDRHPKINEAPAALERYQLLVGTHLFHVWFPALSCAVRDISVTSLQPDAFASTPSHPQYPPNQVDPAFAWSTPGTCIISLICVCWY
jgi:hypothetical protein